ncbi:MAG: hypothetical protein R3309_14800 [Reinekea sp.]|nr:hypothetical protein [Reinekea sp.]
MDILIEFPGQRPLTILQRLAIPSGKATLMNFSAHHTDNAVSNR